MKRYKKFLIALAAIASIFIVRATGIDGGLIDDALNAGIDALTSDVVEEERDQEVIEVIPEVLVPSPEEVPNFEGKSPEQR